MLRSSALFFVALSLGAALAACFDARDLEDASMPAADGSSQCQVLEASIVDLSCEVSPRGEGFAVIMSAPRACCDSGEVTSVVRRSGDDHEVSLEWLACDCCAGCRCIGPIETTRVSLGALSVGTHVVRAHGSTCTLVVEPEPTCEPIAADEVRMPRVLLEGQPLSATLIARDPSGCSCAPRGVAEPDLGLEVCDCCEACECIDPGYEVGVMRAPPPVGEHSIVVPDGVATITVVEKERCRPLEPTSLRIVQPDLGLVSGGAKLTWAVVGGTERLCCTPPAPAVEQAIGPAGELALTLHSCVQSDCDCVGEEVAFEAWHALGEFGEGTRTVRAGAHEATFTAPP